MDDRDRWTSVIRAANLGPDAERIVALVRTTIGFCPRAEVKPDQRPGATQLFCVPDLPDGVAWPSVDAIPLACIAQIDLATVAPADVDHRLPPRGMLWFFASMGDDGDVGRVLYADVASSQLRAAEIPEGVAPPQPMAVDVVSRVELPPWSSLFVAIDGLPPPPNSLIALAVDRHVRYSDVHRRWSEANRDEPRHAMFGYDRPMEAIQRPGETALLQVEAEADLADFFPGETSCLYFFIDDAALARRDFDAVRVVFGSSI
jgi:hypothetical protein